MSSQPRDFRNALLVLVPELRAHARVLCRRADVADDLVQETLLVAWEKQGNLRDPAALKGWLLTILRNVHFGNGRKRRFECEDVDGIEASRQEVHGNQESRADLGDLARALDRLPVVEREALMLVCFEDMSYEEAAAVCGCPVGSVKSRVSRARQRLRELIDGRPNLVESRRPGAIDARAERRVR